MHQLTNMIRRKGDPKVLSAGPSSRRGSDQLARGLGWFAIGLGVAELLAPRSFTRALGMEGREDLVRAYGAREIMSGMLTLSLEKRAGLISRVVGDGLDLATLAVALRHDNPKRANVELALGAVAGITLLDLAAAQAVGARHRRGRGRVRDYSGRSGFPRGVAASRGLAARQPEAGNRAAAAE